MEDTWFEIEELASRARAVVSNAIAKATYTAGPTLLEQTGSPAALNIGILNSELNGGPVQQMEAVANVLASAGVAWLSSHNLSAAETSIEITFGDAADGAVFSWSNALETIRFKIGADGSISRVTSQLSEAEERFFRKLRYGFSGRRVE